MQSRANQHLRQQHWHSWEVGAGAGQPVVCLLAGQAWRDRRWAAGQLVVHLPEVAAVTHLKFSNRKLATSTPGSPKCQQVQLQRQSMHASY